MFFSTLKAFLVVVCLATVGFCQTRKKATVAVPTRKDDMAFMLLWFKETFDNFQQVYKEKEDKDLEALKLAFYQDGKDPALDYVWSLPESRLNGTNTRWFSAGFTQE